MIGIAIVVFREVLEAALVVGIIMAASWGVAGRNLWLSVGIGGGVLGAGLVAAFAADIAAAAAGMGLELLNAAILFLAVAMLACHTVWMARRGRGLAGQAQSLGRAVAAGTQPLYALAIAVGAAILREGSEIVLFIYGIVAGGGNGLLECGLGSLIGLVAGVALGLVLYFGLLRVPMRRLSATTNAMVVLLAAGMAAQGAGFLVQANILPPLGEFVWDSSGLLSERSELGRVLHILVGYVERPAGIQLVFYGATLAFMTELAHAFGGGGRRAPYTAALPALANALEANTAATAAQRDFGTRSASQMAAQKRAERYLLEAKYLRSQVLMLSNPTERDALLAIAENYERLSERVAASHPPIALAASQGGADGLAGAT
ncbi:MAG: FTR1 family protein [Stellaceae bacterium]